LATPAANAGVSSIISVVPVDPAGQGDAPAGNLAQGR
jgi:hypothetical protein